MAHTFLPGQVLQAGEQLRRHHAVRVMKGQSVGRHRTHIHTLDTCGMLGDVVRCGSHAVIMELMGGANKTREMIGRLQDKERKK